MLSGRGVFISTQGRVLKLSSVRIPGDLGKCRFCCSSSRAGSRTCFSDKRADDTDAAWTTLGAAVLYLGCRLPYLGTFDP